MSSNLEIGKKPEELVAPTPQNTPLANAPLTREALSRPTVGTIGEEGEEDAAAAFAQNPALAAMVQSRLSTLIGRSSGYVESLPEHIKRRVEGLKGVQVQHSKVEAAFQKEILELEKRYAEKFRPLYERRAEIIQGKAEPTVEEVEAGEKSDDIDDDDEEEGEEPKKSLATAQAPADAQAGIPEFWLTALKNHNSISELITEADEQALRHLLDIRMTYLTEQAGFKLEFVFDESKNEFFSDASLVKTYYYQDEVGFSGDLVYDHAEGCTINWKEGKDLTHKVETKKQRNKNTNQTRTVKRTVPVESFFNFFSPPKPPTDDDDIEDEEAMEELESRLELDYQIGEDLKDRIIPHAVDYFTGKALLHDGLDEFDDEDFEDEDDEDDDDEDEDEDGPKRYGVSANSQLAGSQEPQECKQQ